MKSFAIVFSAIVMLTVSFTVLVFSQKKENIYNCQTFIQEKIVDSARAQYPHHPRIHIEQQFRNELGLFFNIKFADRRVDKFTKVLSDTMYLQISDVFQLWDTLTNVWVNETKHTYTYDANGKMTDWLYQTWDGSVWVNETKHTYTYDANEKMTDWLDQIWNDSLWVNWVKYSYTYDANGNTTDMLCQTWNGSVWENEFKSSYTYDSNKNRIEALCQNWNTSSWVNETKSSYTYDSNKNRTEVLYQTWNTSSWVNETKHTYTYDANGNMTDWLYQTWDATSWVNDTKSSHTYDSNKNRTEVLYQTWNASLWVNWLKYTYTYDANKNITEELCQTWNSSAWQNSQKDTLTWQMLITDVNERANVTGSFALAANYPNPFNPQTKISFSVPRESYITLKVYDLLGREVATLAQEKKEKGEYSLFWNAGGVTSGVYYYRLVAVDPSLLSEQVFIETKKMILMR